MCALEMSVKRLILCMIVVRLSVVFSIINVYLQRTKQANKDNFS